MQGEAPSPWGRVARAAVAAVSQPRRGKTQRGDAGEPRRNGSAPPRPCSALALIMLAATLPMARRAPARSGRRYVSLTWP